MYIGRHIYITLSCHALISIISTECTSSDDRISGEWVLTDVADNTQLGKEERIGDKGNANLSGYVFRSCIMEDQKVKSCFLLHM